MRSRSSVGFISLVFFLVGCGQSEVPTAPVVRDPELVSQIRSTSIGDFLESQNGTLCKIRLKHKERRELDCGDGVPLWGTPEQHSTHFVRVIKKDAPEYEVLVRKFPTQYQ